MKIILEYTIEKTNGKPLELSDIKEALDEFVREAPSILFISAPEGSAPKRAELIKVRTERK